MKIKNEQKLYFKNYFYFILFSIFKINKKKRFLRKKIKKNLLKLHNKFTFKFTIFYCLISKLKIVTS